MATKQISLTLVLSWLALSVICQSVRAQILDAPVAATGDVAQAKGEFGDGELAEGIKRVSWLPTITMPKFTMPSITMPKMPALWPSESTDGSPALLAPFAAGFGKLSAGTKNAWAGTKDMFSVFQGSDSKGQSRSTASAKPSFWQRLLTRAPGSETPQTVSEFMKQERALP